MTGAIKLINRTKTIYYDVTEILYTITITLKCLFDKKKKIRSKMYKNIPCPTNSQEKIE